MMHQQVILEYGMKRVLWSCTVLVIHGTTLSLAKAAMAVEINVYIATHHHTGHESSLTPKRDVRSLGPKFKKGELSLNMMATKTAHERELQPSKNKDMKRLSLNSFSRQIDQCFAQCYIKLGK